MPDETTTINEVKKTSDGAVNISVEKYEEMLSTISVQKSSISNLNAQLNKIRNEPPVINRTTIIKTDEMVAREQRIWGGTLMGFGVSMFIVGGFIYKAGRVVS